MSLEELIATFKAASAALDKAAEDAGGAGLTPEQHDPLFFAWTDAEDALIDFILDHERDLVSWERQHALRLSPFDEG